MFVMNMIQLILGTIIKTYDNDDDDDDYDNGLMIMMMKMINLIMVNE